MSRFNPFKNLGPGTLVAAAFIGPGTITMCSKAGAGFGFSLLWALVLSIFATIVLQGMAARLGLIYQKGLAEAIRGQLKTKTAQYIAVTLIVAAILIGNSAYQAGNIGGGVLGLEPLLPNSKINFGTFSLNYLALIIGAIAFIVLYIGNYKLLEKALVTLVLLMSVSFVITALMTCPDWGAVFTGVFMPSLPNGSLLIIVGLIGTTVVPYNLFLHASLVQEKWKGEKDLKKVRKDTFVSILLGGIVSIAIVISAAAIPQHSIENAGDLAKGLEPLYGDFAKYFLGIGLFAAGITSAITAPLAAAFVAKGCFGWSGDLKSNKFRAVWIFVLALGAIYAALGTKPTDIITFAQVANGLSLPIIALFLLWVVNKSAVMGKYVNSNVQNIMGFIIILITISISARTIFKIFFM
ncbi:MAG: Nramp family divalent metal transporter [Flavobacteriaceae bacterium]|nr:Nramp family divalent metal transporter [Flavobacteriaceae bacterium]